MPTAPPRVLRFGTFEVDVQTGELRKAGLEVKVQEQPRQVLLALLEHPGQIVAREDLRRRLWPDGTFVDFEHSLNTAVKKLRDTLGDAADNPRFVEAVPLRGYRFTRRSRTTVETGAPRGHPFDHIAGTARLPRRSGRPHRHRRARLDEAHAAAAEGRRLGPAHRFRPRAGPGPSRVLPGSGHGRNADLLLGSLGRRGEGRASVRCRRGGPARSPAFPRRPGHAHLTGWITSPGKEARAMWGFNFDGLAPDGSPLVSCRSPDSDLYALEWDAR